MLKALGHTRLRHPCLACPSRCIDPLHFYNLCKRTLITCLSCPSCCTEYCHPHNHCKRTIIPRPAPPHLPPLSKGGGLTARHKLSLCCVLLAIHPPFLFTKLFAVKTEGLSHHPSLSTTSMSPLPKVMCCRPKKFGRLPEGLLFYRTLSVSQTPPLTIPQ